MSCVFLKPAHPRSGFKYKCDRDNTIIWWSQHDDDINEETPRSWACTYYQLNPLLKGEVIYHDK